MAILTLATHLTLGAGSAKRMKRIALRHYAMGLLRDWTKCEDMQKPQQTLVAAPYSKAKPYVLAHPRIRDREVGGSNPPRRDIISSTCGCAIGGRNSLVHGNAASYACRIKYYRRAAERFCRPGNGCEVSFL